MELWHSLQAVDRLVSDRLAHRDTDLLLHGLHAWLHHHWLLLLGVHHVGLLLLLNVVVVNILADSLLVGILLLLPAVVKNLEAD